MKIKVKRLNSEAKIPEYSKAGDAGMDVYAVSKQENEKFIEYGTGLSFEIPKGYVCLVFPRSSLSNKDLIMANHVGVLDSGFRGELKFRFRKIGEEVYEVGDRIGQIIILPYPEIEFEEVNELSETERGATGFGSTGN
jgi:dUTP pyrophosphatase